jgi:hypothetical protein
MNDPIERLSDALQALQEVVHDISHGAPIVAIVIGRENRDALARFEYELRRSPNFLRCITAYDAPNLIMELHTTIIMREPKQAVMVREELEPYLPRQGSFWGDSP